MITRFTVGSSLLFVLWRFLAGLSIASLQKPVIYEIDLDVVFWVFKTIGLFQYIVNNQILGIIFSILFIGSGFFLIVFPKKNILATCYAITYLFYSGLINFYACHATHYMAGFSIILFAFCAKTDEQFNVNWQLMRYYVCFIYIMAFTLKAFHGVLFDWEIGLLYYKQNIAEYLYNNSENYMSKIYGWFILHPFIVNLSAKIVFLLEGFFVIGFFTKKYDALLMLCGFIIFASIYLFIDVFL
jgi:hypothetical protein